MGAGGKLLLFGSVQSAGLSYPYPDPSWKPISQGAATGSQFPVNWFRDEYTFNAYQGATANASALAAASKWCRANEVNGPCVQLWYPQFSPSGWGASNFITYLKSFAPYLSPGTYLIAANEVIYSNLNDGNLLQSLGGAGSTGWDGLINLIKLIRQYLPGMLLGLNEPSVCDNSNGTGYYGTQRLIQVYKTLAANGAELDWFGAEGYWGNFLSNVAEYQNAINTVGASLVTTLGVGATNTIAFTEFTPGGYYCGSGTANYSTQQACWQAYLSMFAANQYVFGVTGPWGGHRYSAIWATARDANWFWNDNGSNTGNGPDCTNAVIQPSLAWLQSYIPTIISGVSTTPAPPPPSPSPSTSGYMIQSQHANSSSSPSLTIGAAFPNPNSAGSLSVVVFGWNGVSVAPSYVSDSQNNTYTQILLKQANGISLAAYYAPSMAGGASNTVTATFSSYLSPNSAWIEIAEFPGGYISLDGSASLEGAASGAPAKLSFTASDADLVIVTGYTWQAFGGTETGFTVLENNPGGDGSLFGYQVLSQPGSVIVSEVAQNAQFILALFGFKHSSGGFSGILPSGTYSASKLFSPGTNIIVP